MSLVVVRAILLHTAWSGARLMVGFAAVDFAASPFELGLVAASFAAPAIPFAIPAGNIMDRFGAGWLLAVGTCLGVVACVGSAFAPSLAVLVIGNAVLGLGQLLCMIGQQGYVVERATGPNMVGALGNLTSAMSVGQVTGPALVPTAATAWSIIGDVPDWGNGMILCAAFVLAAAPCTVLLARDRLKTPAVRAPRPRMHRAALSILRTEGIWRALVVGGIVLASVDLLFVLLPAWAIDREVDLVTVGWLLALRGTVTVASRLRIARLIARFGRRTVLTAALWLGVAGFGLLAVGGFAAAVIAMILLGVALGVPQPLTLAWVVDLAGEKLRGSALGLRVASNRLVQVALPLAIGLTAGSFGAAGSMTASAVLLGGAAVVTGTSAGGSGGSKSPST